MYTEEVWESRLVPEIIGLRFEDTLVWEVRTIMAQIDLVAVYSHVHLGV